MADEQIKEYRILDKLGEGVGRHSRQLHDRGQAAVGRVIRASRGRGNACWRNQT